MATPPFPLASTRWPPHTGHGAAAQQLGPPCCPPSRQPPEPARRMRLGDLGTSFHCSVVGTCLGTADLRKLVPRFVTGLDRAHASDLDLHHEAVQLAHDGGPGGKALHKLLDERHDTVLRRFARMDTEVALAEAWQQPWPRAKCRAPTGP